MTILQELKEKIQSSVLRPYTLHDMGGQYSKEVLDRIYESNLDDLNWIDYHYIFDAAEDEVVFYIPSFFEYMYKQNDGYDESTFQLALSVKSNKDYLLQLGILKLTTQCIKEIFFKWISEFKISTTDDRLDLVVIVGETRDELLLADLPSLLPDLATEIYTDWGMCQEKPAWSAHLIDVCLRLEYAEWYQNINLFKLKTFDSIIRTPVILKKHFDVAQECWDKICLPEFYKRLLVQYEANLSQKE